MRKNMDNSLSSKKFTGTYAWFDLRNYSTFVTQYEPEEVFDMLCSYYDVVQDVAERYGGKLVDCLGDGVGVMFYGDDDTDRAYLTAKEILKEMSCGGFQLKVGAGIEVGEVACKDNLNYEKISEIYTGKAIVTAVRVGTLLGKAKKELLMTKSAYDNLREEYKREIKFFSEKKLKGIPWKVPLYCAV